MYDVAAVPKKSKILQYKDKSEQFGNVVHINFKFQCSKFVNCENSRGSKHLNFSTNKTASIKKVKIGGKVKVTKEVTKSPAILATSVSVVRSCKKTTVLR